MLFNVEDNNVFKVIRLIASNWVIEFELDSRLVKTWVESRF